MPAAGDLYGQEAVIRRVRGLLAAGRSVLLFGPEAIGKSAIVAAVVDDGITVIDPLERISSQRACRTRRALDRGAIVLAAARVPHGPELGAVGRILWRFSRVRIRELPDPVLRRIVIHGLGESEPDVEGAWLREIVALAQGRPGFASAMGRFARRWNAARGCLPTPALAFAAIREEAAIVALRAADAAGLAAQLGHRSRE